MNTDQLTNEILVIDFDSLADFMAGITSKPVIYGRYPASHKRYQFMIETYDRSIRKANNPKIAPYKCLVIFTDPTDAKVEMFALCNWIPDEKVTGIQSLYGCG